MLTKKRYGAVIVTSANALRGIGPTSSASRLLELPLFTVGEHTQRWRGAPDPIR
jgi:uroporphyrinogen-III synthase